jgi:hypothetical protein
MIVANNNLVHKLLLHGDLKSALILERANTSGANTSVKFPVAPRSDPQHHPCVCGVAVCISSPRPLAGVASLCAITRILKLAGP